MLRGHALDVLEGKPWYRSMRSTVASPPRHLEWYRPLNLVLVPNEGGLFTRRKGCEWASGNSTAFASHLRGPLRIFVDSFA